MTVALRLAMGLAPVACEPPGPGLAPPSGYWPPELRAWLEAYPLAPIPRADWLAYAVAAEPGTPWAACYVWALALADVEGPTAPPQVFPVRHPAAGVLGDATEAERAWLVARSRGEAVPFPSPEIGRLVPAWLGHASGMATAEPVRRGNHFAAVVRELGVSVERVRAVTGRSRGRLVHSW